MGSYVQGHDPCEPPFPDFRDHRSFVGPAKNYDILGALQFNLLVNLGLRERNSMLDIGCGSLRGGRLFIIYLLNGRYFGIEPESWLIQEGIEKEIGSDAIRIKQPVFSSTSDFDLSTFGKTFDFLLAQAVFTHASQGQIRKCLSEARRVMNPDAIFAATIMEGKDIYEGSEWTYPSMATYPLNYFLKLVDTSGLVGRRLNWYHPTGHTWVAIMRPDSKIAQSVVSRTNKYICGAVRPLPKAGPLRILSSKLKHALRLDS